VGSAATGLLALPTTAQPIALNVPLWLLVALTVTGVLLVTTSASRVVSLPAVHVPTLADLAGRLRFRHGAAWVVVEVDGKAVRAPGAARVETALNAAGLRLEPADRLVEIAGTGNLLVQRSTPFSVIDANVPTGFRAVAFSVGDALAAVGIGLDAADVVLPPRDAPLLPGMRISITRALPVTIASADARLDARTHARTVAELLAERGVSLGPFDRVEPPLEAPPPGNGTVRIVRVEEFEQRELSLIQFQTRLEYSSDVAPGVRQRRRAGAAGLLERLVRVIYENDEEAQRIPLLDRILRAATDEIVVTGRPGLSPLPLAPIVAAAPVAASIPGGPDVPYRRVVTMVATAYDPGPISTGKSPGHPAYGITATGMRATFGVVAVDPGVIPFYTRLYIPGYGYAIAADTGGDIRGNRIDLFYPTYGEAIQWGRRTVPVYILE
jgi:3D (Asp-Asp-Asp) domain-containing protein/uncharacterized protein YabE (DUF348 family)